MNNVKLHLDWCTYKAAKYACRYWHYSKTISIGKLVKIGIWEDDSFIGCIIFSHIVGATGAKSLNLSNFELAELTRVACRQHITPISRMLSIATKMLYKQCPGLKAIVSYADPEQNHLGSIYQASNWFYLGRSTPSIIYEIGTKSIHSRTANPNNKHFGRRAKDVNIKGSLKRKTERKYKYIYCFDKKLRQQFKELSKAYPKKGVTSISDNVSSHQLEEGGLNPTVTLQNYSGKEVELLENLDLK